MSKLISELWYGNVDAMRHLGRNNGDMHQMEKIIGDNYNKLAELLCDNGKKLLELYSENNTEYLNLAAEDAFCQGFSLGAKIVAEAILFADE